MTSQFEEMKKRREEKVGNGDTPTTPGPSASKAPPSPTLPSIRSTFARDYASSPYKTPTASNSAPNSSYSFSSPYKTPLSSTSSPAFTSPANASSVSFSPSNHSLNSSHPPSTPSVLQSPSSSPLPQHKGSDNNGL